MSKYDFTAIEDKWQKYWLANDSFATGDDSGKPYTYVLDMFPYPSGDGLHVGHVKIYTASDILARYLRLNGHNILHPTGWDAFGLPTENSAIKMGIHPAKLTQRNIDRFRGQMQRLGLSYDWKLEVNTTDPNYYKWTQWIFLQLFKAGLAYEDTVPINWCPDCKTGLANEEVVAGACERCGTAVVQKPMKQWLLKITQYADRLLKDLDGLDWPKFIIELQQNWIGRSEGADIIFEVDQSNDATNAPRPGQLNFTVFTTRPDTLYGATYLVLAPEHPLVKTVTTEQQQAAVTEYTAAAQSKTDLERSDETKKKTGVFTGSYAINPINQERLPIWIADYVLLTYGSGAIMAVPAHDARDHEFAQTFDLPIRAVIEPQDKSDLPFVGEGVMVNSGPHDGQPSSEAKQLITQDLIKQGKGKEAVNYKLRDWVFSRQRYWGEPIPIIHCEKCGPVPVPEDQLPVELPAVEKYEPTGTGESPLANLSDWVNTSCPKCQGAAQRETNTMPQWAGSSWYFLRFADPVNQHELVSDSAQDRWLPVDTYIGGAEHAVLHLLYARFWTKALFDQGIISIEEPFSSLRNVGLVMGEDGQKMSKSRGNVINPDDIIAQYGADTLRIYEMFLGPFSASAAWDTNSISGAQRFLKRVFALVTAGLKQTDAGDDINPELELLLHQTIKKVSESTASLKFNTAVSALMEFSNELEKLKQVPRSVLTTFVILLSPYAPHLAEELWQQLGSAGLVADTQWPVPDDKLIASANVTIPVQVNAKLRGTLNIAPNTSEEDTVKQARDINNVAKHLEGAAIKQIIYVPDRLINFVVKPK